MGFCDRRRGRGKGRDDGRRTWERERAETPGTRRKTKSEGEAGETREEPRCSGLARRGFEAAAGCASATWRGSPRH